MKRTWFGIALLAVLLALSLWSGCVMERNMVPVGEALSQANALVRAADWSGAQQAVIRAQAQWERHWKTTAALADHAPMEEIDALFAELSVYAAQKEEPDFSAACARLTRLTAAMYEAHAGTWWNLA